MLNIYNHSYSLVRSFPTSEVKVYDSNFFNLSGNGTEVNSFGIKGGSIIFKTNLIYLCNNKTLSLEWTSEFNQIKIPIVISNTNDELISLLAELMFFHYSYLSSFVYSRYIQEPHRFPGVLDIKNMHKFLLFVQEEISGEKLN